MAVHLLIEGHPRVYCIFEKFGDKVCGSFEAGELQLALWAA